MRTDWYDFPDVVLINSASTIKDHASYTLAKAGNIHSAMDLVLDYLTYESMLSIKNIFLGIDNIMFIPVHAEEQLGRNKIPVALAQVLSYDLNIGGYDGTVVQINRAYRTQADGYTRLVRRVQFEGNVLQGANYIMVDDAITQGGTLADLRAHIIQSGGNVIGAVTLMGKPHSAKMRLTKATLGLLRKATGQPLEEWWYEEFKYDFSKFTECEARYFTKQIHKFGLDSVRDSIFKARFETS